jgi:hypothetical protein
MIDLKLLDFDNPNIKKNWCLRNTRYIFWIAKPLEQSANDMFKYCDKFKDFEIWDVLVVKKWNNWLNADWQKYWHIWVITKDTPEYFIMSDWTKSFPNLKILKKNLNSWLYAAITPYTMIKLWATRIKESDIIKSEIMKHLFDWIAKKKIFNTSEEDYNKSCTIWDLKDLIEIAFKRFEENNNKFQDR